MARFALGAVATDLSAVTATGAGTGVQAPEAQYSVWSVTASAVTTGGTVLIQGSLDGTNYYTISTVTVSANGTQHVVVANAHPYLRSNVSARTDGTYTTKYVIARGDF
jgi:hypothetical protein